MHRIALRTPALFPKPQVKNTLRIPIYQLDAFASARAACLMGPRRTDTTGPFKALFASGFR